MKPPRPAPKVDDEAGAVRAYRERLGIVDKERKKIEQLVRDRAKQAAELAKLRIVQELLAEVERGKKGKLSVQQIQTSIALKLKQLTTAKDSYVELVVRNNVQLAYNSAKVAEFMRPEVKAKRPFWVFWAQLDSRTSRICRQLHRTVRPAGDAWFMRRTPPLHHACRSTIRALTPAQSENWYGGVTTPAPRAVPAEGWGRPMKKSWVPNLSGIDADLVRAYRSRR